MRPSPEACKAPCASTAAAGCEQGLRGRLERLEPSGQCRATSNRPQEGNQEHRCVTGRMAENSPQDRAPVPLSQYPGERRGSTTQTLSACGRPFYRLWMTPHFTSSVMCQVTWRADLSSTPLVYTC
ncbi:hypothetical protein NDU88_009848 [Pleurodeles waltl]|uniref:Uncharacterized protein n=1 Tax=Pleurodeles waltl TaxID=8319 RepID=A0AAV7RYV9_PLEWA|nr:hypothetical protein NDU88_009848 [Pleurodeles waltl]